MRNLIDRTRRMPWALIVLALPAAVAVWSGWVGLGEMTAFGVIHPLPGIWDAARINTAITLPVGVEAYAAYALRVWLGRADGPRSTAFARRSSIASLALGMVGQVAYHLMAAAGVASAPWQIVTLVSCLPVVVLGMGCTLAHLRHSDRVEADRQALEAVAETEARRLEEVARVAAEAEAEAVRIVEAEAAKAQAEAEAARAAESAAEAALERERLRAERLARNAAGKQGAGPRKAAAVSTPETGPESASDLHRRTEAKAAFLASVGSDSEWSNRRLAEALYATSDPSPKQVDAARVNARNWCRTAGVSRSGKDASTEVSDTQQAGGER